MVTIQSQNFGVEIEMTGVSRGHWFAYHSVSRDV